jgi:hypothetical protein
VNTVHRFTARDRHRSRQKSGKHLILMAGT